MKEKKIKFIEERFPEDISYGSSGGPCYLTDVVVMVNGCEQRNINWSNARAKYNVAHGVKTEAQLQKLIAFFRTCKGRAIGFRFKDWNDFKAVDQLLGVADGNSTEFQLSKTYRNGDWEEARVISKPVVNTVKLYLNDTEFQQFEIDYSTGFISFVSPPILGTKITVDFEFDIPVRFDTDQLCASVDAYKTYSWNNIPLVEIRV